MAELSLTETFTYKDDLSKLGEFVRKAEEQGMTEFTWSGYSGDQREPAQLTIKATGTL